MSLADEPFVYVTTTGRKSGQPRRIEIWFVLHAGCIYLFAENGLRANWVANILRDPRVGVELAGRVFQASARVLDREREAALWIAAQERCHAKYGWGEGLVVEIRPDVPLG